MSVVQLQEIDRSVSGGGLCVLGGQERAHNLVVSRDSGVLGGEESPQPGGLQG